MIFPYKEKQRTTAAVIVTSIILAICMVVSGRIGGGDTSPSMPCGATSTTTVTTQAQSTPVVTAATNSFTKAKVAYGKDKYPSLTTVDYGTYRTLDYQKYSGKTTYFYDFHKTWNSGPDFYGVVASADKNVLTYMAYTELDSVKVKSVVFYTFDEAQSIALDATPNKELTCKTDKLANGPYILAVWFDVAENGKVITTFDARTVYVSDGNAWFAEAAGLKPGTDIETWLADQRNDLAANDAFQTWVARNSGNDLTKATDASVISYPFKGGTDRYPNDAPK